MGELPRPTGPHRLPSSSREIHGGSPPPQASAHQVLDTVDLSLPAPMPAPPSLGPGTHSPDPAGPPIPSYLMLLWLPLPASVPPTSFSLSPSRSRSFSSCSRWSSSWWGRLRSVGPGEAAGCTSPFRLMSLAERCRGRGEAKPLGPASRRRFA